MIDGKGNGGMIYLIFTLVFSFLTMVAFNMGLAPLMLGIVLTISFLSLAVGTLEGNKKLCKAGASIVMGVIFTAFFATALEMVGGKIAPIVYQGIFDSTMSKTASGFTGAFFTSDLLCP